MDGVGLDLHVGAALGDEVALLDVVLAGDHLGSGERGFHVEDGRQVLDVEGDGAHRPHELGLVRAGQEHHRLVDVVDAIGGEDRLVLDDERDVVDGHVLGADDGDVAPIEGGIEAHAAETAARDGAAHGGAVELSGLARQIVHVPGNACDLGGAVQARHAGADRRSWGFDWGAVNHPDLLASSDNRSTCQAASTRDLIRKNHQAEPEHA